MDTDTTKSVAELRAERSELIDKRGQVANEMTEMREAAKKGDGFNADTQEKWERMGKDVVSWESEIRCIDTEIKLRDRQFEDLPEQRAMPGRGDVGPSDEQRATSDEDRERQAELRAKAEEQQFRAYLQTGAIGPEVRSNGFSQQDLQNAYGMGGEQRALMTTVPAQAGVTVPETWADQLVKAMKDYGGIMGISNVMTTGSGEQINFVTRDGTNRKGRIIAEGAPTNEDDMTFDTKTLNAYMYTSDRSLISLQLLQDNIYNVDREIIDDQAEMLGRITADHLAVGVGGTTEPEGAATGATVGRTSAAAGAISFLDMINLKHSVNTAYRRRGARWVFSDITLLTLKSLLDGTGVPLWNPNLAGAEASTFDGDPYTIDDSLQSPATGNFPVLYGDFSKYRIRRVGGVSLFRYNELYMPNHQIGFQAFMRMDAKLIDGGGGAIKKLEIA